jgi:hypothetical protein
MPTSPADLYEQDFYSWTQRQARELRRFAATRPNISLDLPHLAEEIADLGKEQRNARRTWTQRIIEHLLLLEHSPATDPRPHWIGEIVDFRSDIKRRLTATLRRDLQRQLPTLFQDARQAVSRKLLAHREHSAADSLPVDCPYAFDQILDDWWPDGGESR